MMSGRPFVHLVGLSISPSQEQLRAARGAALPVTVLVVIGALVRVAIFGSRIHNGWFWTSLTVLVGGALALGVGHWNLFVRNARLFVDGDRFGQRTALGKVTTWPRAELMKIVAADVRYGGARAASPQWLFLAQDGRRLMVLNPRVWKTADLDRFARSLGAVVEHVSSEPIKAAELRRRFPHATPWWQAHTVLLGVIAAVVAVAVLTPLFAR
jgi:hypothetical protein